MKPHPLEFWYELQVNPSDVRRELHKDSIETIDKMEKSSLMTSVVRKTIGLLTGYDSLEEMVNDKDSLFVELWCLWKFYQNRRRTDLIRTYANTLEQSVRRKFLRQEGSRKDRFNCLVITSVYDDDLLKRFLLMDSVDIRSFQKLRLTGVGANSSFNPLNRTRIADTASSLIGEFEKERGEQRESIIERAITENSSTFLFVRRQIKEAIVTQTKDSVIVKPAERIAVQFLNGGKEVHVSARTKKIALDFVNLFAQKAWGKKLHYERIPGSNEERRIKSFLEDVCSPNATLPIVAIKISQSPLRGYPDLELSHQDTLVPSIKQLKGMNVDVLKAVENIEWLVVRFENTEVALHPTRNRDGTFELRYSDNKLPWTKRDAFEKQLSEQWHLDVTPKG